jgi:hypothetical protein
MRINVKALALSTVAFCATAAFAANQARVEVPFSFTAQGHSYPAGSYEVAVNNNNDIVTMVSKADPKMHISWTAGPGEAINLPALVKFDQVGADHALKTIQVGDKVTPKLDKGTPSVSASTSIGGQ